MKSKDINWLSVRHFTFICDAAKESIKHNGFYDKLAEIDSTLRSFGVSKYEVKFK